MGKASLKPISETRWTVRHASLKAFISQYMGILAALDEIASEKKNATAAATAAGYATQMRKMEEFLVVLLAKDMFQMVDVVATQLQGETITIFEAKAHIETLRRSLASLKESSFQRNRRAANDFTQENGLSMPKEPRASQPPARFREPGM